MKKIIISLLTVFGLFLSENIQAQIVSGGGTCYTVSDPNTISTIRNGYVQNVNCVHVFDTVAQKHYNLVMANPVGSKWVEFKAGQNPYNTNFALNGTNDSIQITDGGGVRSLAKIAIAPVQSVTQGGDITVTNSNGTYTVSYTDGDKSATNELQTISTASNTVTLSNSGGSFTVAGAGINTVATSGSTITVTATEVDGSITNELQTISTASNTVTLSNSGGSFTVAGAGINTVATSGSTITVTATEVDGSTTNEIQTISSTAPSSNSSTVSNSLSGGSFTVSTSNTNAPLTLTGSANAMTIGMTALSSYTNDTAAAAGGIPLNGWYKASSDNTMGLVPGTMRQRAF